jgi:hypothetical protein
MPSFIQQKSEYLFSKIKQNQPIPECLNIFNEDTDPYELVWFVYYMYFAIHNPKMEEYINKKASDDASSTTIFDIASIIKNMIKRRHYTSTIVYQLYTHAYTQNGNITHIYPKHKGQEIIKSYDSNHLKTTAVHIKHAFAVAPPAPAINALLEHITSSTNISAPVSHNAVLQKINNIQYKRKDIIILSLICYMKMAEEDINTKSIFIAATTDESTTSTTTATSTTTKPSTNPIDTPAPETLSPYDIKYKYLYR